MDWLRGRLELMEVMVKDNPHLVGVAPLTTLRRSVPLIFSDTSNPTEAKAWIMMIEKFFIVIDCSEEQKKKKKKKPLMQHLC